jgi:hypothetical protein
MRQNSSGNTVHTISATALAQWEIPIVPEALA